MQVIDISNNMSEVHYFANKLQGLCLLKKKPN